MPAEVKQRRLEEVISVFREEAARVNAALLGSTQLILVEGVSIANITTGAGTVLVLSISIVYFIVC